MVNFTGVNRVLESADYTTLWRRIRATEFELEQLLQLHLPFPRGPPIEHDVQKKVLILRKQIS
jgi:hypothetical protein